MKQNYRTMAQTYNKGTTTLDMAAKRPTQYTRPHNPTAKYTNTKEV